MNSQKMKSSQKYIENFDITKLIPYARNSRTHSETQVAQIAASIREFGFTNPVLIDADDGIIAGHGRVMAAQKLGFDAVPVIRLSHLTETQKRAYIIADNKLALNAGWNDEMLRLEIAELDGFDLDLLGFDSDELSALLDTDEEKTEGLTDPDDVPDVPIEPVTKPGDIWLLGNHRLMCGDSTSIDAVEALMDGKKADLVFTDPPYNVAFNGRSGRHDVIKNDDLTDVEFANFIVDVCNTIKAINPPIYYIWCNWKFYGLLQTCIDYKACIVWAKNVFGMGRGYRHQHEFCLFSGQLDDGINNESDLWQIAKDTNYVHPTQKPTALAERALGNHKQAKVILDLFGGSGSTLIAAEKNGRHARLMELDPKYCDVIIKRWQDFTGNQAVLESTGEPFTSE